MPFDDDYKDLAEKSGLKINASKSMFSSMKKPPTQEEIQSKAKETIEKLEGYQQEVADFALLFKKIIEDKTLSENKNIIASESEKDIISNMIQFAVKLNNDQNEESDGMGSVAIIAMLIRGILHQRDKINKLEYNEYELNKKLNSLNDKVSKILNANTLYTDKI